MSRVLRYGSIALLTVIMLSMLSGLAFAPLKTSAASTVSISTSRDVSPFNGTVYKNEEFYVDVSIVPPPSTGNITLLVTVGSSTYAVNATRIGLTATYRANFTIDSSGTLSWVYKSTSKALTTLSDGDTIKFSYGGVSKTLTFVHKAALISVRDQIPAYYAKLTGTADWEITAPDLDKNPYAVDSFSVPTLSISVYDPYTGTTVTKTLTNVVFTETGPNTGIFALDISNIMAYTNTTEVYPASLVNANTSTTLRYVNSNIPVDISFTIEFNTTATGNITSINVDVSKLNITNNNINTVVSFSISKSINGIANKTAVPVTLIYEIPAQQKTVNGLADLENTLKYYVCFNINVTYYKATKEYNVTLSNLKVKVNALEYLYYWVKSIFAPVDTVSISANVPKYLGSTETDSVSASVKPVQATSEISAKASLSEGLQINVSNPLFNIRSYEADYAYVTVYIGTDRTPHVLKLKESDVNTGLFQGTIPASTLWNELLSGHLSGSIANISIVISEPMIIWNPSAGNWQVSWINTSKTIYVSYCKAEIENIAPSSVVLGKSVVTFTLVDGDLRTPSPLAFSAGELAVKDITVSGVKFARLILEAIVENVTSGKTYPVLLEAKNTYTLVFTEVETGKFNIAIDLSHFSLSKALAPDEKPIKLEIIYEDEFTPSYKAVNVTATIPVLTPSISVDRSNIPLTKVGNPIVQVTIVDPESNKNPYIRDVLSGALKIYLVYYNGTSKDITPAAAPSTSIMETGVDTSTFVFNITVPSSDIVPGLIGGCLKIEYTTPESGTVLMKCIPFKLYGVKILVNGSSSIKVKYGQHINITVIEPDANLYNSGVETFTGKQLGITVSSVVGNASKVVENAEFKETGPGTGVFTAVITVDKNLGSPGSEITLKLTDETGTGTVAGDISWFSEEATASITIAVSKASMEVPSEHGPYGIVTIKVVDPDMNENPSTPDSVPLYIYLNNMPAPGLSSVKAVETGDNTGVFEYNLNLSKLGSPADLIGSTITVMYVDRYNPTGSPVTLSKSIKIVSWDGKVVLSKKYYELGEPINITVVDPDANSDPNKVDTVWVLVTSSATPITKNITLYETGPDTGVFSNVIRTTSDFVTAQQPKYIYAKYGDTITVKYYDRYPADYGTTKEGKWFEATATIGVPVEKPIKPSEPKIVNINGQPTTPKVGKTVIITYNLTNTGYEEMTFTVLFIVRNAQGVPIVIQMQQVTLPAGATQSIGFGFTPTAAGNYTIEIHVIKSLSQPGVVGQQVTKQITVTQ